MKNALKIVKLILSGSTKRLYHAGKAAWWRMTVLAAVTLVTVISTYVLGFYLARYGESHEPSQSWASMAAFIVAATLVAIPTFGPLLARTIAIKAEYLEVDPKKEALRPRKWPLFLFLMAVAGVIAECVSQGGAYVTGRALMQISSATMVLSAIVAVIRVDVWGALIVLVSGKAHEGFKLLPEVPSEDMKAFGRKFAVILTTLAFMGRVMTDTPAGWRYPALGMSILTGFGLLILSERSGWLKKNSLEWIVPSYATGSVIMAIALAFSPRLQSHAAEGARLLGQPRDLPEQRLLLQKEAEYAVLRDTVTSAKCGGQYCSEDDAAKAAKLEKDIQDLKSGKYCYNPAGCKEEAPAPVTAKAAGNSANLPPPPVVSPGLTAPQGLRLSPSANLPPPPVLSGSSAQLRSGGDAPRASRQASFVKNDGPPVVSQPRVRRTIVAVNGY